MSPFGKQRKFGKSFLAAVTISFCIALVGGAAHGADVIRVNGSGIALDMMKPMIRAFEAANPGVKVQMERPLGSSGAIKALLSGALDLVVSSKVLTPEQTAQGAAAQEYGKTPLALVTAKDNPAANVTTQDLEEMYSLQRTAWPNGSRVRVVLRPESDIDTTILRGLSAGMNDAIDKAKAHPGMLVAVTDPESNQMVANTPGSIGASGLPGILHGDAPLKILTLNGVQPTTQALAEGKYPLAKDIRFVTTATSSGTAKALVDFAYSAEGRAIAQKAGVLLTAASAK